jgi:hypothetical protein
VSFTTDAADEFKEAFNFGLKRRIDGYTWLDALAQTKQRMTELADELVDSGRILAGACMRGDRDILVCYTPENPPGDDTTWCPLRKLGIRFFGTFGWHISRSMVVGVALQWLGFGVMAHDYIEACGKIDYPYQIQGFWWGLLAAIAGFGLLTSSFVKWMKRRIP